MRLRHLQIRNFRGVRSLDWTVGADYVCLVGPGDSTKTTVLEAIEYALSPRWSIPFDDSDFFELNPDHAISITATVGDLPDELVSDKKFGHHVRGWSNKDGLHDEPQNEDELVLSIRLHVDESLEPIWSVVTDRNEGSARISSTDRGRLECLAVREYLDRELSWSKGSVLSRLTTSADKLPGLLADSGRAARRAFEHVDEASLKPFIQAAGEAQEVGGRYGVAPHAHFRPDLDARAIAGGERALSLHDGEIPLRRAGLGTRRLLLTAMQCRHAEETGLTLIDEVEYGLDPHRLRKLLRVLRAGDDNDHNRQIIMSSHSPIALGELGAEQLQIVRSQEGATRVLKVSNELQRFMRRVPEAFLGRKVIVAEGKTEVGFCRYVDELCSAAGNSFALAGVAIAHGGGGDAAKTAAAFASLAYDTMLLGDSDEPLDPSAEILETEGVQVLLWADGTAIEERVIRDLPWIAVADLVEYAVVECGASSVRDSIAHDLGISSDRLQSATIDWVRLGMSEIDLRLAIGAAAKRKGWFKRVDRGEQLGRIVCEHYDSILGTDIRTKLDLVRNWVVADV